MTDRPPFEVSIDLYGIHRWFGDDFRAVLPVLQTADRVGIDEVTITDHVVMGERTDRYPYGRFNPETDYPWHEPLVTLSAIAAVTERIRLSCGVLIAPLRPAVLLAKQLATLDVLSRGRLALGVGVGWQREEYEATGIPWEDRYRRLEEQIEVCHLLWREAPAAYTGSTVKFDRLHAYPRPYRRSTVPFWFGLAPTERNCARIAEFGAGWAPIVQEPAEIAAGVERLRAAFVARGRDPSTLGVRVMPKIVCDTAGRPDLDATLAQAQALYEVGTTVLVGMPAAFCRDTGDVDGFYEALLRTRDAVRRVATPASSN